MVQWTLGLQDGEPLPLYHVVRDQNIAVLQMKEHSITAQDVSEGSLWQTDQDWLTRSVPKMPLKKNNQIFIMKKE